MAQVINDPWASRAGGFGNALGTGLGQGLSQSISQLAQHKLNTMIQNKQRSQLIGALTNAGIEPQNAALLSMYPPELQFKMMQALGEQNQAPAANQMQQLSQSMNNQQQLQQVNPLEQFNQNSQQQQAAQKAQQEELMLQALKPINPMDAIVAQKIQSPKKVSAQIKEPIQEQKIIEPAAEKVVKKPIFSGLTPAQKLQEKKMEFQQQQAQRKELLAEQHRLDKEQKPYVEMLDKKGGAAAKESDMVLDRMEKLIDSGKLTGSTMYNFRKKMEHSGHIIGAGLGTATGALVGSVFAPVVGTVGGATIGGGLGAAAGEALMPKFVGSKEDQEFTKLSLGFMNKLKDIFGGRIAIQEMQMYMDSIPTLSLTDDGKRQVIKDMRLISQGWRHKKEIKDKIVNENNGHYPLGIEQMVEERAKPYMDRLAKQFIDGTGLTIAQA